MVCPWLSRKWKTFGSGVYSVPAVELESRHCLKQISWCGSLHWDGTATPLVSGWYGADVYVSTQMMLSCLKAHENVENFDQHHVKMVD